jgi:hypothetical protein
MNWETIGGVVRHILTFGGGYLVAKGVFDQATLDAAIPAVITLGGVIWSIIAKKNAAPPAA